MISLADIGYDIKFDKFIKSKGLDDYKIGRIIRESKKQYIIRTELGDFNGQISGKLRHEARNRSDYPAVGDWVATKYIEKSNLIIHSILPRKSIIERQAIGKFGKKQTIAANVDVAFVLQDIVHDLNLKKLDRLIAICHGAKIKPIIILTKIDIANKIYVFDQLNKIEKRFNKITIIPMSNKNLDGFCEVKEIIKYGKTYCFIGASGAGKSSLINNLIGKKVMHTKKLREKSNKGQHTTSHRELFILKQSGVLIDTPGMRELGITEDYNTLESTFNIIFSLAKKCKYSDCTHLIEPNCAVIKALKNKIIDKSYYNNFQKMKQEQQQFELNKRGLKDNKMIKKIKFESKNKKRKL